MKNLVTVTVFILALAAGCNRHVDEQTVPPVAEPMVDDTAAPVPETTSGLSVTVVVEDGSLGIPPEAIPVGPVLFTVNNAGQEIHGFQVEVSSINRMLEQNISPGETRTLDVMIPAAGTYRAFCPLHTDVAGESKEFTAQAP